MIDDHKHDTPIAVRLTDRLLLDTSRECARLDKKPAELIRYALRLYLYGTVGMLHTDEKKSRSDDE